MEAGRATQVMQGMVMPASKAPRMRGALWSMQLPAYRRRRRPFLAARREARFLADFLRAGFFAARFLALFFAAFLRAGLFAARFLAAFLAGRAFFFFAAGRAAGLAEALSP
jgi:hypothetical protein